jgi:hypothetical protein
MRLRLPLLLVSVAMACASLFQAFRSAEEAGLLEVELRAARATGATAIEQGNEARRELERWKADAARLERELDASLSWAQAIGEALVAEGARREQSAVAAAAASALVINPPPFGVQRCILALRDCLRADGFEGMQLLRAAALEERELRDVEFLTIDRATGRTELVVASRMLVTLDRATKAATLEFYGGALRVDGIRTELHDSGHKVVLEPVAGKLWEERLPYLVQAKGNYEDASAQPQRDPRLDSDTRAAWLERLDSLLVDAGAEHKLRIAGFAQIADREFRSARLVGYDDRNLLALTADCEGIAIEVDARARVVSLRLRNGTLRRPGAESTIGDEGYRMLLPNLTPERASSILMGMVVER